MGLVEARATIRRRPYIYTRLRSTYRQEPNGGLTFRWLSEPGRVRGPRDFQRIASLVPFTFNWFYIDRRHIAYQNSGANPVRARGTDASLPIFGKRRNEWRGWDPGDQRRPLHLPRAPPQRDRPALHRGLERQAGARLLGGRRQLGLRRHLPQRSAQQAGGGRDQGAGGKMTLPKLVDAMEDAATVDLRGSEVLPWALRVLGRPRDPSLRAAVATLRDWVRSGAHRIDRDRDGRYDHAEAVRIMDAWWPRWMRAEFEPALGRPLFERILAINELANLPNNHGDHLGSAWQDGWYSYALKDLRMLRRQARPRPLRPADQGARAVLAHLLRRRQAPVRQPAPLPLPAGARRSGTPWRCPSAPSTAATPCAARPAGTATRPASTRSSSARSAASRSR